MSDDPMHSSAKLSASQINAHAKYLETFNGLVVDPSCKDVRAYDED